MRSTSNASLRARNRSTNSPACCQRHAAPSRQPRPSRVRVSLEPHRGQRAHPRQLLEQTIPDTGALDDDTGNITSLGPRLRVVTEIGHQQDVMARDHDEGGGAAESGHIPDVGPPRHQDAVEPLRFEQPDQRLLTRVPAVRAHDGTRDSRRGPRVPTGISAPKPRTTRPPDRQHGTVPLRLAQNTLDRCTSTGDTRTASNRIAHRETRVREGGGIDHCAVGVPAQRLNRVHELALVIGLCPAALHPELLGNGPRRRLDLGQRGPPVHFGLTLAEQVEIGAVQNGDVHYVLRPFSQAWNWSRSSSSGCGRFGREVRGDGRAGEPPAPKKSSNEKPPRPAAGASSAAGVAAGGTSGAAPRPTWSPNTASGKSHPQPAALAGPGRQTPGHDSD
jgi:hypothetical protein